MLIESANSLAVIFFIFIFFIVLSCFLARAGSGPPGGVCQHQGNLKVSHYVYMALKKTELLPYSQTMTDDCQIWEH